MTSIGVVAASAGGVETLRSGLVQPLINEGHQVAVTLTPTAAAWLDHLGEVQRLEDLTVSGAIDTPAAARAEAASQERRLVGAPMTANSVAKLALGIADNQALTVLCECVATVPMIIFPRVNAAHARHPPGTTISTGSAQPAST